MRLFSCRPQSSRTLVKSTNLDDVLREHLSALNAVLGRLTGERVAEDRRAVDFLLLHLLRVADGSLRQLAVLLLVLVGIVLVGALRLDLLLLEAVRDVGDLSAVLEVDGLGDVEAGRLVRGLLLAGLVQHIGGLALALEVDLNQARLALAGSILVSSKHWSPALLLVATRH